MASVTHGGGFGLKHLQQRIEEINLLKVEVGWFASAQHPTEDGGTIPTATIAAKNEFGDPEEGIPPRPFMRPALADNRALWREQIRQGTKGILQGTESDESVMEKIGLSVSGHIRANIAQVQDPPLKPATIAARLAIRADKNTRGKLDKPLVFEGILLNSVTYIVKDGEEVTPFQKGGG